MHRLLSSLIIASALHTVPLHAEETSPSTASGTITDSSPTTQVSSQEQVTQPPIPEDLMDELNAIASQPLIVGNAPRTIETSLMLAEKHPTLSANYENMEQSGYALRAAKGARLLSLSGDAEAGGQYYNDEDGSGSAGVGNIGLSLLQPLADGGRRRGAVYSAKQRLGSAAENYAWQKRLRRYTAASAHINLWLAQELARNNADNVGQLEEIVTEVRTRLNKREATITEAAEAESRLATSRSQQAERIAALGVARSIYLRDVGEDVTRVEDPGAGISLTAPIGGLHPLVSAAQHAVQVTEGQVRQREAAYRPTLDLRGRASHNAFAGTMRDDKASQGQLTLNLGYNFIDGGIATAETSAAKAARREAEADLATTKLEIESSLLNAQSTYTEAERRLSESVRAQTENAEVIKNLTREVIQGNRTVRDLLDARRDQLAASNAWAQAYASRALSSYDVERWQ